MHSELLLMVYVSNPYGRLSSLSICRRGDAGL